MAIAGKGLEPTVYSVAVPAGKDGARGVSPTSAAAINHVLVDITLGVFGAEYYLKRILRYSSVNQALESDFIGGAACEWECYYLILFFPAGQVGVEVLQSERRAGTVKRDCHEFVEAGFSVHHQRKSAGHGSRR